MRGVTRDGAIPRVAFQGARGAFGEEAIRRSWQRARPVPCRSFTDVVAAVARGSVDFGVLPVTNTIAGTVGPALDVLLAADGIRVTGETAIPVHHALLAVDGATLADVRTVISHPIALAQCGAFLRHQSAMRARAWYDTAGAARAVARRGDRSIAAIASRTAATRYSLAVLADGIQDTPDNVTRFWILERSTTSSGVPHAYQGAPATQPAMRGIRGAITIPCDDRVLMHAAVHELLREMAARNRFTATDVISAFFTVTPDLTSDFPAHAARTMGWTDVPMLCATEIAVGGALPRCIRVLLHVALPHGASPVHVYLRDAMALRPDRAG